MTYLDIHTHQFRATAESIEVLNLMVTSRQELDHWLNIIHQAQAHQYFSAGLHPWDLTSDRVEKDFAVLSEVLLHPKVLMLGECGLDRNTRVDWHLQMQSFEKQAHLASQLAKPLIIHCVRSFPEIVRFKQQIKPTVPWLIHGFNNNAQILHQLLNNQFYVSLGSALLKNDSNASKGISTIPIEQLFLETDDKNCTISSIFVAASKLLDVSIEYLQEKIYSNFNQIVLGHGQKSDDSKRES
jgi:TatD DNase family protein